MVANKLTTEGDSRSLLALTIFMTGSLMPLSGKSEFETNARNGIPLALWAVDALLPPQEMRTTLTPKSSINATTVFFKPGTPKSKRNKDLDARKRDYSRASKP